MPKFNGRTKLAGFVLSLVIVVGSVWGAAIKLETKFDAHIEQNVIDTKTAKEEGCLPSRENTTKVLVLESQLNAMNATMKDILMELKK